MDQSQKTEIVIKAADEDLKGRYANNVHIVFTPEEFVLDFMNILPTGGNLTSRIIMSPGHVKRLSNVLTDLIGKYENQIQKIEPSQEMGPIGFQQGK